MNKDTMSVWLDDHGISKEDISAFHSMLTQNINS